ncbi:MAG: fasciclin domain-containing protein [Flavobacterium sp.]|jgi:uncharacterized surface protein with fasciclin (FAS1) repeats|uniref:fasciclin domain-containing protein n=1 Tax=Flavobacterium sp. TaxID=239 RepID=UPI0022BAFD82|nr:fasciclin domain-containing protein [Flavobacterium sp.]MCZ8168871.1 fasciclin domain-containing protein [Flavobacterium sp.]MCZ8296812.1 fasciclin domain-containing protein [Flavobacterium sp.]
MKKTRLKQLALITFLALSLFSCNEDERETLDTEYSITGFASRRQNLSFFFEALNRTGLSGVLSQSGSYTVFAPLNDAFTTFFNANGYTDVESVPVPILKNLLLNHVISNEISTNSILATGGYASTLSPINDSNGAPTISMFLIKTGNEVIINGGDTNKGIVIKTEDDANIININATNGIIHIVKKIIEIPTVVNHVVANPQFDTLQTVVTSVSGAFGDQSAVLAALNGLTAAAPATVFAPDNAAFTAATTGTGFAVNATPAQVSKVLQYHVTVAGNVRSNQLTNNQVIPMITSPVQNTTAILGSGTVDIRDFANNLARVNQADIQCSNGVIHGINRVLQPQL